MILKQLRFRQIHLDFHTSEAIFGIGERFDKTCWQETLQAARVDSITLFAKCHHGWSYHPTKVGKMHPHLTFDLLRAQYEACKEIGIQTPIYLSAGVDNLASYRHPEWRVIGRDGRYAGWTSDVLKPGFHSMDFFSPYVDYLCAQIREVVQLFPDCDGIFLDIICQYGVFSRWGMDYMAANGLNPACEEDQQTAREAALDRYYHDTTAAAKCLRADMPIFHNSGHIRRGKRSILKYSSHLELESLPTGGWGYDHFPMAAKYAVNLGLDFLGMTGKFHTTWGEFGGHKHPNALRYECSAMLAFNSKCSVGDQLHPSARLDPSTYRNIGIAYREVEAKEPWCQNARSLSDIGVLSCEAENVPHGSEPDEGVSRVLLEGHFLFDLIDRLADFCRYKLLILPDGVRIDEDLKDRLDAYLAQGGRLLLSGESGLWREKDEFAFDLGLEYRGASKFSPDFILPAAEFCPDFVQSPVVMYLRSQRVAVTKGQSLGKVYDPYFNRTYQHFCSHQHTPCREEPSGFDCGVRFGAITYLAHPLFSLYRGYGAVAYREFVVKAINSLMGDGCTLQCNLPSTGRISLNHQAVERRYILHLLYANTINRGGLLNLNGGNIAAAGMHIEVIEELIPLRNIELTLFNLPEIARVTLEPQGEELNFTQIEHQIFLQVEEFTCHQIIALHEK